MRSTAVRESSLSIQNAWGLCEGGHRLVVFDRAACNSPPSVAARPGSHEPQATVQQKHAGLKISVQALIHTYAECGATAVIIDI